MIPYDSLQYHTASEKIVRVLCDRTQSQEPHFFRLMVANYFAMAAASMHTMIMMPEGNKIPVNMYSLNLAPSSFGKTRAAKVMSQEVLNQFIDQFTNDTFPIQSEINLAQLANERAIRRGLDPDAELSRLTGEFQRAGELFFCFDSGTVAGAKQLRHKLLLSNVGALNLIVDEIGLHMGRNTELLDIFMELYDGEVSNTLNKNTADSPRNSEMRGTTPSNMLLFGTSNKLLDGGKQEDDLMQLLESGYARRCFFGFVADNTVGTSMTPTQALEMAKRAGQSKDLEEISDRLGNLSDMVNINKTLIIPDDTALAMYAYKIDCENQAAQYKTAESIRRTETASRFFKTIKLAGAYAFVDDSIEITKDHLYAAIAVAEDSGKAFERFLRRDKPYVKLAKYIAETNEEITHADLDEDLVFYPKAQSQQNAMLTMAIAWGYGNNIIIKRRWEDGIEFFRGESLKETDLSAVPISYTNNTDMTTGYLNEVVAFDQLYKVTQAPGFHWTSHHLANGYRNEENAIPGFSYLVVDVDGTCPMPVAQKLLEDYKALYYTTKSHTPDSHRYRIVLPCSHQLKLDAKDFKEFYNNFLEWLPFPVDPSASHRCKKWTSHPAHYEYTEGELLDVLPFIPKTAKNEQRKVLLESQQAMDNLERWMINRIGDGNRNNMLLRYGMILVDAGMQFDDILNKVLSLNSKISDKLDEAEILTTIMTTVRKAIAARP